jgi:uncharacterized protein
LRTARDAGRLNADALDAKMRDYGRERTKEFLLKNLYVVFATARTHNPELDQVTLDEAEHRRVFDAHIAHQLELEASGKLFAAGPLFDKDGNRLGGMIVLRADSFEEAQAIVDSDPHRTSGLWDHRIERWLVSEGSYTVTIKYSSQTAQIE